jgi:hypothetical protein
MKILGNITLSMSSNSEPADRHYEDQLLDVHPGSRTGRIGTDGRLFVTGYRRNIIWYGATVSTLQSVRQVKITRGNFVVVDALLATDRPRVVMGGISFEVKAADA